MNDITNFFTALSYECKMLLKLTTGFKVLIYFSLLLMLSTNKLGFLSPVMLFQPSLIMNQLSNWPALTGAPLPYQILKTKLESFEMDKHTSLFFQTIRVKKNRIFPLFVPVKKNKLERLSISKLSKLSFFNESMAVEHM